MSQTKTRGRPPVERRRVPMTMRVTPELHDQIVTRAEAKGRSITQEAELLIEQALLIERSVGSKQWRMGMGAVVQFISAQSAARRAGGGPEDPLDDPAVYESGMASAIAWLASHWPGNPTIADIDRALGSARQQIEKNMERDQ